MSVGFISSSAARPHPRFGEVARRSPWFLPPAPAYLAPNPGRNVMDRRRECHLNEQRPKVLNGLGFPENAGRASWCPPLAGRRPAGVGAVDFWLTEPKSPPSPAYGGGMGRGNPARADRPRAL